MNQVTCLYCGNEIPADAEACPQCGKPSHFKKNRTTLFSRRQFYLLFGLVALLCATLVFWFPRTIP